jgi:hypothetical protein
MSRRRERAVARYLVQDTWALDPWLRDDGFNYLQDILMAGGVINRRYPYAEQVNTEFARAAMETPPPSGRG